jgi:hypothetical protein
MEPATRVLAQSIVSLDTSLFNGPNTNANKGRRNSLGKRASNAANAIANGDFESAIELLESLLLKIDGIDPPPDWMEDSTTKDGLAADVAQIIDLLSF